MAPFELEAAIGKSIINDIVIAAFPGIVAIGKLKFEEKTSTWDIDVQVSIAIPFLPSLLKQFTAVMTNWMKNSKNPIEKLEIQNQDEGKYSIMLH